MIKVKRNNDGETGTLEYFNLFLQTGVVIKPAIIQHSISCEGIHYEDVTDDYTILDNTDVIEKIEERIQGVQDSLLYNSGKKDYNQGSEKQLRWVLQLLKGE